ncbi:MAG TPA: group II truncated hemoglobin [Burkholderiales bacterium]|nr:group II truncated hemoglobin [Burkholderiales bacterium]
MQPDRRAPPYERIGGADGVRRLVRRFYELMDELPHAQGVRNLHGESLAGSEEKLFKFLSGWLGGPQLFIEEYGHPMLRRRHMPFSIGDAERDQWMICMNQALSETVDDGNLRLELSTALSKVADHMRNQAQDQNLS